MLDLVPGSWYRGKKRLNEQKSFKNEIEKLASKQSGRTEIMTLEGTLTCPHLSN